MQNNRKPVQSPQIPQPLPQPESAEAFPEPLESDDSGVQVEAGAEQPAIDAVVLPKPEPKPMPKLGKQKGFLVEAVRDGYIKGSRIPKGMRFYYEGSFEKAGLWMKFADETLQKQHQAVCAKRMKKRAKLSDVRENAGR